MSMRSFSRKLQRLTGLPYTRCFDRLRQCKSLNERREYLTSVEKRLEGAADWTDEQLDRVLRELGLLIRK